MFYIGSYHARKIYAIEIYQETIVEVSIANQLCNLRGIVFMANELDVTILVRSSNLTLSNLSTNRNELMLFKSTGDRVIGHKSIIHIFN